MMAQNKNQSLLSFFPLRQTSNTNISTNSSKIDRLENSKLLHVESKLLISIQSNSDDDSDFESPKNMKDVAKKLYLKQKKYQKNENMKLKKKQTDSSVDTHIKEGLKENLQRFSFKIQKNTKNPQVLNSFERKKKLKGHYIKPLLFIRTQEDRQRIISEKVEFILSQNCIRKLEYPRSNLEIKLTSDILLNYWKQDSKIYNTNCQETVSFYIKNLCAGKDNSKCGNLLKNWKGIPGRSPSPILEHNTSSSDVICCTSPDLFEDSLPSNELETLNPFLQPITEAKNGICTFETYQESISIDSDSTDDSIRLELLTESENNLTGTEESNSSSIESNESEHAKQIQNTPQRDVILKKGNITPLNNFKEATTPDINDELHKFGMKVLEKQKGIRILKHIYEVTHPFVTQCSSEDECKIIKKQKLSEIPTINNDENRTLNETGQTVVGDNLPLDVAWNNLLLSNPEIHEKVLLYEPLNLKMLHNMLRKHCSCKIQDLLRFLDKKCITVIIRNY